MQGGNVECFLDRFLKLSEVGLLDANSSKFAFLVGDGDFDVEALTDPLQPLADLRTARGRVGEDVPLFKLGRDGRGEGFPDASSAEALDFPQKEDAASKNATPETGGVRTCHEAYYETCRPKEPHRSNSGDRFPGGAS